MDNLSDDERTPNGRPSPCDFDSYLPWACGQLHVDAVVIINRIYQKPPSTQRFKKSLAAKSRHEVVDSGLVSVQTLDGQREVAHPDNMVKIDAMYDVVGNLLQLKFDNKNIRVPPELLKLIGVIIHYHKNLASIIINTGFNNQCLYELKKLVVLANLKDVCLDNTEVHSGNYDLILQDASALKFLSMSRCNIDDAVVKRIAAYLEYPQPASKTLAVLNLTSNLITDEGAIHLGNALKSNRQLAYLNLAGNKITDEGAKHIFETLTIFLMTDEEVKMARYRNMQYIKERNNLINEIAQELKQADLQRRSLKKKTVKPSNVVSVNNSSKKSNEKDPLRNPADRSVTDFDTIWLDRAKIIAEERMGQSKEPYSNQNIFYKNNQFYCFGNNQLAYINIAYNNVSYLTVKLILSVLIEQESQNRIPRGLVNVCLEGNAIPSKCRELEQIDSILLSNLPEKSRKA